MHPFPPASPVLTRLMYGDLYSGRGRGKSFDGRGSLTIEDAMRQFSTRNPATPPLTPRANLIESQSTSDGSEESIRSFGEGGNQVHLYFPAVLTNDATIGDVQKLVEARNLFAFLRGQPLVGTPVCPTNIKILLVLVSYLNHYQFTNIDGSNFGEAVLASTDFLVRDLKIGDMRGNEAKSSEAKILEALILGESLKFVPLYNQAFAHAAGIYQDLQKSNTPLWNDVSEITRTKLYQAASDLKNKIRSAEPRLADFNFPSLFTGLGNSTSSPEAKIVRFARWKYHFMTMRRQVMSYYKDMHGSWPPKPNSKNQFITKGLNRLVLKGLYNDLCVVYDCLVDRKEFTTRSLDMDDDSKAIEERHPMHAALRKILAEYDRSQPPVQPPIPFDVPLLPTVATVEANFFRQGPKDQNKLRDRKLQPHETQLVLMKASSMTVDKHPFLEMFRAFELAEGRGMNERELVEMRYGHWLFIYTVIQSLPLLVTDVPDLLYTEGVESWLCQHPLGGLPWMQDNGAIRKSWYGVGGAGGNVVSMPSDVVNYGVEATYRRSHCWAVAEKWLAGETDDDSSTMYALEQTLSPLSPPPGFIGGDGFRGRQRDVSGSSIDQGSNASRSASRDGRRVSRQSQRNSIALGLERLPFPAGESPLNTPGHNSRPGSSGTNQYARPESRNTSPVTRPMGGVRHASSNSVTMAGKESTFDDILSGMADEKRVEKEKHWVAKKKSGWLLGGGSKDA